ncbi:MAG: BadF/BadG/BcrA/BcrD ATPase family protein, partial [bacterium]
MRGDSWFAGVDAGATKIRAALAESDGRIVARVEGPGVNAALSGPDAAADAIASLLRGALRGRTLTGGTLAGAVVGLAGAWAPALGTAISRRLRVLLECRRVIVRNDAVAMLEGLAPRAHAVLLSVGTGAVAVGRTRNGRLVRADGWGPLAGDAGAGFWIGRRALEAALAAYDGRARPSLFTRAVLRRLGLHRPAEDIHRLYARSDARGALAALAPLVITASRRGDRRARAIVRDARRALAATVATVRRRLPPGPILRFASGGLAAAAPEILPPGYSLSPSGGEAGVRGSPDAACLLLAFRRAGLDGSLAAEQTARLDARRVAPGSRRGLPVTERSNPATAAFSRLPPLEMVKLMHAEDLAVAPAVGRILPRIARAVRAAERALRRGGRLIYVGAGTSGRLGVLDAS